MHRLAWHRDGQDEAELRESLILALLDSGETVTLQDEEQNYLFIANLPDLWRLPSGMPPDDSALFGPEIAVRLAALKDEAAADIGRHSVVEIAAGEDRVFQFHIYSTRNRHTQPIIKTTIREISAERRRERLLRSLLREVSHRSKNLLSIIQSLASQTARFTRTRDDFLRKFRGRLHALAQSQDLVTDSDWRGAHIFSLLRQQRELFLPEYPDLVVMTGEDVLLTPNAALHIGLAFHELVVNTVSHASSPGQHMPIEVSCRVLSADSPVTCELVWVEPLFSGDACEDTIRARFGSILLEKVVPSALGGDAVYEISPDMIRYCLRFSMPDQETA